jgi:hypothetical protein
MTTAATTDAYQDAVNKLMSYIDQTANFAKGQLPDIANELLVFGVTQHTLLAYLFGSITILAFLVFLLGIWIAKDGEEGGLEVSVVFFLIFGVGCAITGAQILDLYQIKEAPKIYVLHELHKEISNQ